jgi:hypothetical protein
MRTNRTPRRRCHDSAAGAFAGNAVRARDLGGPIHPIVISVIAGTVVGLAAVLVDAPSPMVLALITGLLDLIPQIGSTIAAIIVCVVTLIASGLTPP